MLDAGGMCNFTVMINECQVLVFNAGYRIVSQLSFIRMLLLTLRIHLSSH